MNRRLDISTTLKCSALGCAIVLASCAGTPQPHPELVALQNRYSMVLSLDHASQEAGSELEEARQALDLGREAHAKRDQDALAHYLFVAGKTLDIARARIDLHETQLAISSASGRKDELVLAAREGQVRAQQFALGSQQRELAAQEQQLAAQRGQLSSQARELERKEAELDEAQRQLQQTQEQARLLAERLTEVTTKVTERGTILVLSDIVFDFDSAALRPGSRRAIEEIAAFLVEQDSPQIAIEGHTDAVGSDAYNETLSLERAQAVRDALMREGVPRAQMDIAGLGEDYPVATNDTDAGRQQNRRVEIVIADQLRRPVLSTTQ